MISLSAPALLHRSSRHYAVVETWGADGERSRGLIPKAQCDEAIRRAFATLTLNSGYSRRRSPAARI